MLSAFERLVALRYLRAKRQEGFISVVAWFSFAGIMLGVATLIVVVAVMNGFRAELLGRIIGMNGHVTVTAAEGRLTDWPDLLVQISKSDGVIRAMPMVRGQVMASSARGAGAAEIRGMRAEDLAAIPSVYDNVLAGSFSGFQKGEGVLIGYRLANRLGVTTGGRVTLLSAKGVVSAKGTAPTMRAYSIAGVFQVGRPEVDESVVFMPLSTAQSFFSAKDAVDAIEVSVTDPYNARQHADDLQALLGPNYAVTDWLRVNRGFVNALNVERTAMAVILSLIVIVAGFNVVSSQIMLAQDKARGIAVLRTMGSSRASILRIFLLTGSSVGIIGTAFGAALGLSFALNIEAVGQGLGSILPLAMGRGVIDFLARLPAKVDPMDIAITLGFALVISIAAALYPAWRAARLDPVMVLRYE